MGFLLSLYFVEGITNLGSYGCIVTSQSTHVLKDLPDLRNIQVNTEACLVERIVPVAQVYIIIFWKRMQKEQDIADSLILSFFI